jgi:hypothetical protein
MHLWLWRRNATGIDFYGWNTSVEGNFSQHFGLNADFAGVYRESLSGTPE